MTVEPIHLEILRAIESAPDGKAWGLGAVISRPTQEQWTALEDLRRERYVMRRWRRQSEMDWKHYYRLTKRGASAIAEQRTVSRPADQIVLG